MHSVTIFFISKTRFHSKIWHNWSITQYASKPKVKILGRKCNMKKCRFQRDCMSSCRRNIQSFPEYWLLKFALSNICKLRYDDGKDIDTICKCTYYSLFMLDWRCILWKPHDHLHECLIAICSVEYKYINS